LFDHASRHVRRAEIGGDRGDTAAELPEPIGQLLQALGIARDVSELRSRGGQRDGRCRADASGGAGQKDMALHRFHVARQAMERKISP
jgi:hypothetical protein